MATRASGALFYSAAHDKTMVGGFAAEMEKAGKSLTAYGYEADHAFANRARYDEADTQLAWAPALEFLAATL